MLTWWVDVPGSPRWRAHKKKHTREFLLFLSPCDPPFLMPFNHQPFSSLLFFCRHFAAPLQRGVAAADAPGLQRPSAVAGHRSAHPLTPHTSPLVPVLWSAGPVSTPTLWGNRTRGGGELPRRFSLLTGRSLHWWWWGKGPLC